LNIAKSTGTVRGLSLMNSKGSTFQSVVITAVLKLLV